MNLKNDREERQRDFLLTMYFDFDTNGDLTPDTNILTNTPANILTSGVRNISGFNFLRIQETGTYTATSSFTICRRRR